MDVGIIVLKFSSEGCVGQPPDRYIPLVLVKTERFRPVLSFRPLLFRFCRRGSFVRSWQKYTDGTYLVPERPLIGPVCTGDFGRNGVKSQTMVGTQVFSLVVSMH